MSNLARLCLDRIKYVDRRRSKAKECHVLYLVSAFVDEFTTPLPRVFKTLQRSCRVGMETGDIEKAFRSWQSANYPAFTAGFPLDSIEMSSLQLLQQMAQYNVCGVYNNVISLHFTVMHLIGKSDSPLDWAEELKSKYMLDGGTSLVDKKGIIELSRFFWSGIQLAYYFREIEIAGSLVKPLRLLKNDLCFVSTSVRIYFSGLVSAALAKKTGKKAHLRLARKALREMKDVVKNNGANNLHRYLLMKA